MLEKEQACLSGYVFGETALRALADEPKLQQAVDDWKAANQAKVSDQQEVLWFLFTHAQRYAEPEWLRYPVAALM